MFGCICKYKSFFDHDSANSHKKEAENRILLGSAVITNWGKINTISFVWKLMKNTEEFGSLFGVTERLQFPDGNRTFFVHIPDAPDIGSVSCLSLTESNLQHLNLGAWAPPLRLNPLHQDLLNWPAALSCSSHMQYQTLKHFS